MLDLTQYKAKILLAEDNITNQQVTLAVLENMGLVADAVANGQEAITALAAVAYDLVLMDCQMPVLDGYEATRMIRNPQSTVRNHQVPVIAMTAHAVQAERDRCRECGMDDFLSKPVIPQALAQILEKWLIKPSKQNTNSTQTEPCEQAIEKSSTPFPVWDQEGMFARLMGDVRMAATISQGFLLDMPLQIERLEASLTAGNAKAVCHQAHTIRGAAAIIGGERLKAVAQTMERSAQLGHLKTLQAHLAALHVEFEVLKERIQHTLLSGKGIDPQGLS
ncbi:MAG: response regulator [Desulfobulbus sp.]|nr:response regulator [Desulfobulbus sp.]